jgi:hypothetical protein
MKITVNHDNIINKLSNQAITLKKDVQDLQVRTKALETQLGNIAKSKTLILARFVGKPKPNLVEDLKMMRMEKGEEPEELDYSNSSPDYTVVDLVKMITFKNPGI